MQAINYLPRKKILYLSITFIAWYDGMRQTFCHFCLDCLDTDYNSQSSYLVSLAWDWKNIVIRGCRVWHITFTNKSVNILIRKDFSYNGLRESHRCQFDWTYIWASQTNCNTGIDNNIIIVPCHILYTPAHLHSFQEHARLDYTNFQSLFL